MASMYHLHRVLYECSCGEWQPHPALLYCTHCGIPRCSDCGMSEVDSVYCPNCLDCVPSTEAKLKKNRCYTCHKCPVCFSIMSARSDLVTGATYLCCNMCRWSTRDSGIEDQAKSSEWPIPPNPHESWHDKVVEHMSELEIAEKAERENAKFPKLRSSLPGFNAGLFPDRYGFQKVYQARKKAMQRPAKDPIKFEPTTEVPALDNDVFGERELCPSLDSLCQQPYTGERTLMPIRVPFVSRKALRCGVCEHFLLKLDAGPTVNYKIANFGRNHIPEIRLSREPRLDSGPHCSVFLSIYNHIQMYDSNMKIVLLADPAQTAFECTSEPIELLLSSYSVGVAPNADLYSTHLDTTSDSSSNIVFRGGHRAGVRLDIVVKDNDNKEKLALLLKYKVEQESSHTNAQPPPEWQLIKVRVDLNL